VTNKLSCGASVCGGGGGCSGNGVILDCSSFCF
jgi:hypothetical protein